MSQILKDQISQWQVIVNSSRGLQNGEFGFNWWFWGLLFECNRLARVIRRFYFEPFQKFVIL